MDEFFTKRTVHWLSLVVMSMGAFYLGSVTMGIMSIGINIVILLHVTIALTALIGGFFIQMILK